MEVHLKMPAVANHIVNWLKNYAISNGMNGFVVGVSGGVDSAVVSKLCAMTGLKTVCVMMPIHQNVKEVDRAQRHVDQLVENAYKQKIFNVDLVNCELSSVCDHFLLALRNVESFAVTKGLHERASKNEDLELLSEANLRSRMRMSSLYYIASNRNLLVVGTGNMVEDFGVGFFTKYGDGGVDISPISNLYKTEVYELAKTLGIIDEILEAKPTDGLWSDGRTDEDQIGATYAELEAAMEYVRMNPTYSPADLESLSVREQNVLRIYLSRHSMNKHKMVRIPECSIRHETSLWETDADTKKLIDKLRDIKEQKNVLIRAQKYDEAALMRHKEKEVMNKLHGKGITV